MELQLAESEAISEKDLSWEITNEQEVDARKFLKVFQTDR